MALFGAATFLLFSMGRAIVVAPVTAPLMFVVVSRHPTPRFRTVGAVLVSLTVAEVAWALTYLGIGEATPWIWLLPVIAALGAATAFTRLTNLRPRTRARGGPWRAA